MSQYGINKKGYFFTVDAMLGISVMVLGIVLVLFGFVSNPVESPQFILGDDILRVLANTESDQGKTFFQEIGEAATDCDFNSAEEFSEDLIQDGIVPGQYNFKLFLREDRCSNSALFDQPIRFIQNRGNPVTEEDAKILITSRKIIFDQSNENLFDPYVMEARVWR